MKITWGQDLGEPVCPYARRWVLNLGFGSLRVHHWYRSDDKRAPHDHPWWFVTLVLSGSYEDWGYPVRTARGAPALNICKVDGLKRGSLRYRPAHHVHSVSVNPGGCWTVLLTGAETNQWGFWTKRKDGAARFLRSAKYFRKHGHHPCDQP
jgi:hypothetical protein